MLGICHRSYGPDVTVKSSYHVHPQCTDGTILYVAFEKPNEDEDNRSNNKGDRGDVRIFRSNPTSESCNVKVNELRRKCRATESQGH